MKTKAKVKTKKLELFDDSFFSLPFVYSSLKYHTNVDWMLKIVKIINFPNKHEQAMGRCGLLEEKSLFSSLIPLLIDLTIRKPMAGLQVKVMDIVIN